MPRRSSPASGKGVLCTGLTEPADLNPNTVAPDRRRLSRGSSFADSGSGFQPNILSGGLQAAVGAPEAVYTYLC